MLDLSLRRYRLLLSLISCTILTLLFLTHFQPALPTHPFLTQFSRFYTPKIGSEKWLSQYPSRIHGPAPKPEWLSRYHLIKHLIPNIPKATLKGGLAHYPDSAKIDDTLCSYRRSGCLAAEDIVMARDGRWAVNFDDGPLPPSKTLYEFLDGRGVKATHFWVGANVKEHWELAVEAVMRGNHLAVHTWSHAHLTCYTDEEVIGELGWTMQIIKDISGYTPKYLRPPYGDTDARIRAIAKHVFGMETVIWNLDSNDWALNQTYASGDFVDPPYDWATVELSARELVNRMKDGNRQGVIALEHELSEESVRAFIDSWPELEKNGWRTGTVADVVELEWYQ